MNANEKRILDHRHQSTAEGWARYGGQTKVAEFPESAGQDAGNSAGDS